MDQQTAPMATVTILGTATPYPRPDQPCSGFLVASPNARLWIDAGSGTLAALQRFTDLEQLDALWLSHMHPDHTGDLPALANWLINRADPGKQFPVFGPPGWLSRLTAFLPTDPELLLRHIDAHELHDGHRDDVGDLRLTTRAVHHSVPAYGVRIEYGSHAFAYSGDSALCPALAELAQDADVFVCESGAATQTIERQPSHCTPEDAAHAAQQANAARLLLTHLAPSLDAHEAVERAAGLYAESALAISGSVHEI